MNFVAIFCFNHSAMKNAMKMELGMKRPRGGATSAAQRGRWGRFSPTPQSISTEMAVEIRCDRNK